MVSSGSEHEFFQGSLKNAKNRHLPTEWTQSEDMLSPMICPSTTCLLASLPGFINLPLSQIEEWSQKIAEGDALLDPEKNVVVMCHHGMRYAREQVVGLCFSDGLSCALAPLSLFQEKYMH